jgi:hypothetical protein
MKSHRRGGVTPTTARQPEDAGHISLGYEWRSVSENATL